MAPVPTFTVASQKGPSFSLSPTNLSGAENVISAITKVPPKAPLSLSVNLNNERVKTVPIRWSWCWASTALTGKGGRSRLECLAGVDVHHQTRFVNGDKLRRGNLL